jgi:hypothetical protein
MTMTNLRRHAKLLGITVALCSVIGVAACKTPGELWRYESASRLAAPANLLKRQVSAGAFSVSVYERVRAPGKVANIYIEGDGRHTLLDQATTSIDPTPSYPLALHLATRDLSENVIYVARPCQYNALDTTGDNSPCTRDYWNNGRFSIETMEAMNTVLDKLKNNHSLSGFNLIGYDGGAAVATLLAAKRKDVVSIRTVAGNLDTDLNSANHKQPGMVGSLNPRDFAADIAGIPQTHFIGEWDQVTGANLSQSFRNAMGHSNCVRISTVAQTDHEGGWANRWPSLLNEPVDCNAK